jgi:hypothetical protein
MRWIGVDWDGVGWGGMGWDGMVYDIMIGMQEGGESKLSEQSN